MLRYVELEQVARARMGAAGGRKWRGSSASGSSSIPTAGFSRQLLPPDIRPIRTAMTTKQTIDAFIISVDRQGRKTPEIAEVKGTTGTGS